ncbi:MAG: cell wall-active antibiotics response protein [Clostridiales bacterium]|jgi:predicted membrane protein|nr:cell wall-active antibiotics response protein [Clostridiales bacterium]
MRNKLSNMIWGLIFIVIGVGIAGNVLLGWNFRIFFDGWWTLFIIIPCLISIIRSGITVGASSGLIIGVMLLVSHYININIDWWKLIIPVILIIIGLNIMFQGLFRKPLKVNHAGHVEGQNNTRAKEYSAIFASNKISVNDRFTGTILNAIFGGITLDLRDAIIDSDVEIAATAVFGGMDIYVPRGVTVKVNNIPIFGGVSDKTVRTTDPSAYTIYLNSTTMFGGIDIK